MKNIFALKTDPGSNIPDEIYGYRPYLLSFSAAWVSLHLYSVIDAVANVIQASAMYGYDSAFIGGTLGLPSFQRAFGLDQAADDEVAALSSNIVSTFQAGAFFGCIIGFFTAEKFGRKPVIMGSAVLFIIGVILQMIGKIGLLCTSLTSPPINTY